MLTNKKELILRGSLETVELVKQRGWTRGCDRYTFGHTWHKVKLTECEIIRDGDTYILFAMSRCWCGAKYRQY